jgi:hypothetical protein
MPRQRNIFAFTQKVKLSVLLFASVLISSQSSFSQKSIEKGLESLSNKNYGLANDYFRSGIKKSPAIAYLGLSKLYVTQDFRQLDSAFRFVLLADGLWSGVEQNKRTKWKVDFAFDSLSIQQQKQVVSQLVFEQIKTKPSVEQWNAFILKNNWYHSLNTAVYLRDQLAFEQAKEKNSSIALKSYIDSLPESSFVQEAQHLFYDLQFHEYTRDGALNSFVAFYTECPENTHHMEAAKEIYSLATTQHSLQEYASFVRTYQNNPFVNEAWRNVYKIYLKDYSEEKYHAFQQEYPDYPFMQELAVDIDLFQMKLYPVIQNGRYGFMNGQGKLIIPSMYNEVGPFQEGLAVVSKDDKFGIIDKKNQVVVDFQYDEILEFVNNRAIVRKEQKYGVIDRLGKLIFPLVFDDISYTGSLYDTEKDEKIRMYDLNFQEVAFVDGVLELSFSQWMSNQHPEYEFIGELDLTSNRAVVKVAGQLNYIDSTGKLILTNPLEWFPDALSVAKFNNGFAVYRKKEKYGLIDLNGKLVQKAVYESSGPYTGFWPVKDKGNWALLDVKGKVVLPFEYDFIRYSPEMGYLVGREEVFGLVNEGGKMLLPVSFSNIKPFEEQFFYLTIEDKHGLFTRDGKEVLAIQYDRILRYDSESLELKEGEKLSYYFPSKHSFVSLVE